MGRSMVKAADAQGPWARATMPMEMFGNADLRKPGKLPFPLIQPFEKPCEKREWEPAVVRFQDFPVFP